MQRLKDRCADYGLHITFNAAGQIVTDEATAADIVTALLDHRLGSGFSEKIFDVQSAVQVTI